MFTAAHISIDLFLQTFILKMQNIRPGKIMEKQVKHPTKFLQEYYWLPF